MKKDIRDTIIVGVFLMLVVIIAGCVGPSSDSITGDAILGSSEVQNVKLSYQNSKYVLEPATLKKGIPVRMEADLNTVSGCMQNVVISEFNVNDYVKEGDNVIEFVPDKSGTFNIACSMGMGATTFTVLNDDGTKSNYVENAPTTSSCGSTGGCGCGA